MIKIEMAVQISQDFPAGRSTEYIWMSGQPWPVPADEDSKIVRIEAFGGELGDVTRFRCDHELKQDEKIGGAVVCRTWYLAEARYVSEQMRISYPSAS